MKLFNFQVSMVVIFFIFSTISVFSVFMQICYYYYYFLEQISGDVTLQPELFEMFRSGASVKSTFVAKHVYYGFRVLVFLICSYSENPKLGRNNNSVQTSRRKLRKYTSLQQMCRKKAKEKQILVYSTFLK